MGALSHNESVAPNERASIRRLKTWFGAPQPAGALTAVRWQSALGTAYMALVVVGALVRTFTLGRVLCAAMVLVPSIVGLFRIGWRQTIGGFIAVAGAVSLVGGDSASVALLAVYGLSFEAGYLDAGWESLPVVGVAVTFLTVHAVIDLVDHIPTGWYLSAIGTITAWGVGCLARRARLNLAALRRAQAELAEQARSDERQRIARDVHDLVAHSLSVTMLHLTAARLALRRDPERAETALMEAERIGRQSMAEIRRTVGLLPRSSGEATAPVPGAGDVGELVDGFRRAGMDVTLAVEGNPQQVPAPLGLSLYRIVQEALTNAARHAPGEPTSVAIRISKQAVDLQVDNRLPRGRARADTDGGHGLAGMAERAGSAGGCLSAGPSGGRWAVSANLPVDVS